ncbi:MAG: glycosyltransferase family 39 protein [Candidatus Riflebacteria bacterium]|nr:glycosyltransferase family 39 protein [Candidatus Riflebacteria bacterium]
MSGLTPGPRLRDRIGAHPWLTLYLVALLARLIICCSTSFHLQDTGFLERARSLAAGQGHVQHMRWPMNEFLSGDYRSFTPPLYSAFLAMVMPHHGADTFRIGVCQAVLFSLMPLLLFRTASLLFACPVTAWGAGLIGALYPSFVYCSNQLIDTGMAVLLFCAYLLAVVQANRTCTAAWLIVTGVVGGLNLLVRANMVTVLAALPLGWLALSPGLPLPALIRRTASVWAVTALVVLPWTVRNCLVHGQLVVLTTNGGYNLWLGNNDGTRAYLTDDRVETLEVMMQTKLPLPAATGLAEADRDAWLWNTAREWMGQHCGEVLGNAFWKARRFWALTKPGTPGRPAWKRTVYALSYGPLLALAIAGWAIACVRRDPAAGLTALVVLSFMPPFLLCFGTIRMRAPLDAVLVLMASVAIASGWTWMVSRGSGCSACRPSRSSSDRPGSCP